MGTQRSGVGIKGIVFLFLAMLLISPLAIEARDTPQLSSTEAMELAFEEVREWDREAVLWYMAPPGRLLDYRWAENDLSWDWTAIFVRYRDSKRYRVRMRYDEIVESVEEIHTTREHPIPEDPPGKKAIISMKDAAAAAFREGAPLSGRPMVVFNMAGKSTEGWRPQWEFLFGSVYRIYIVDAVTGKVLDVRQFDPRTGEKLDHLLDTGEMEEALHNSGEMVIYRFFDLIDRDGLEDALEMMNPSLAGNDQMKEMWKSGFASLDLIRVVRITKEPEKKWHNGNPLFEVELFTRTDPGKGFFGWEEGFNTRWISLEQTEKGLEIAEIATGP
ncbi:MAG TPA: hypothetical protein PLV56_00880 [Synergistales bacterium]|nr:hypothetical protein [Synergistales bacterium]